LEKTARGLIKLLTTQDVNLRLAALRVVAALEMRNKTVVNAIAESLDSEHEALQVQALRALAFLGPADAIQWVAPMILESGAVRQHAAQVMVMGGSASVPVLRKLYAKSDVASRRIIASTLGEIGGRAPFQFLMKQLPTEDLEMVKHITGCLRTTYGKMTKATRLTAVRDLRSFLKLRTTSKSPHAVIAALVLLGGVSEPKAVVETQKLLFPYMDRRQPEAVRRNAAVSLSRLLVDTRKSEALVPKLLPYLLEAAWTPVVQNVLPLLQRLELSPAVTLKLLPLLRKSPHTAVRMHVLGRLHGIDKTAVVKEVLPFLSSQNSRLRDGAEAALKTLPSSIDALFDLLLVEADSDIVRRIQWVLRAHPEKSRQRYVPRAVDRVLVMVDKGQGRKETLLEFICSTDSAVLQKKTSTRLKSLKRSSARNRYDRMEALLKMLAERKLLTTEQRYEYALLLLRNSKKDVRREARTSDPSLRAFAALATQDGAKLIKNLKRERALGAEDYYYLGFHFSEGMEVTRPHGAALLNYLVDNYPRHKLKRPARQKLDLLERSGSREEA